MDLGVCPSLSTHVFPAGFARKFVGSSLKTSCSLRLLTSYNVMWQKGRETPIFFPPQHEREHISNVPQNYSHILTPL